MPNTKPLVSILIPSYNSASYIAETLESVIAQTYNNWECLIVDDHSTDNSVEIAEKYCKEYPNKIRLYTNPRKGACAARNTAFDHSHGDFIQYLDADDLLSRDKIEKQITLALQSSNDDLLTCQWARFLNKTEEAFFPERLLDKSYNNPTNWIVDALLYAEMTPLMSWLTPKNLINKAGNWNENLLVNQDGEFFSRVILNAKKIIFEPKGRVYYRQHDGTRISARDSKQKVNSLIYSFDLYEKNFEKYGTITTEFQTAIANAYFRNAIRWYPKYKDISNYCLKKAMRLSSKKNLKVPKIGGRSLELIKNIFGWRFAKRVSQLKQKISKQV